jgi:hypothetical protein
LEGGTMRWIKVHQSIGTHRKVLKAAELLRVREAEVIGYLVLFWLWAADNTRTGVIDVEPRVIARICGWRKSPRLLVEALLASRLLEMHESGAYKVVNFEEHISPVLIASDRHRILQAEYRRRRADSLRGHAPDSTASAG